MWKLKMYLRFKDTELWDEMDWDEDLKDMVVDSFKKDFGIKLDESRVVLGESRWIDEHTYEIEVMYETISSLAVCE